MTEIAFHFGAPDKLAYACRLLRKAVSSGAKVMAVGDATTVSQLDIDLWALSPTDFIPHCHDSAEEPVRKRSTVVLATAVGQIHDVRDVLVNLGTAVPEGFEAFNRLIEVVSTVGSDRELARVRWKFYTERGYLITRHDLALKRSE